MAVLQGYESFTDRIHQLSKQDKLDPRDYEFIAERYYRLSMQKNLGPRDAEEIDSILGMAASDRQLEFLLNEVDHMVAHDLDLIDPDYIQAQQHDLEKRILVKKCSEQVSEHIQDKLKGFGLYGGAVDGFYGKETQHSLQIATKKVQKHLKQEKVYRGWVDGQCNLELEKAINRYKANLSQDRLGNTENEILELSNVVCTQIPAFPDSKTLTTEPPQTSNPKTKPNNFTLRVKRHPALMYLGLSASLVGAISALSVGSYQRSLVSQENNNFQLYSPSSKMQNTAYKESSDSNQFTSDSNRLSYTSSYSSSYRTQSNTINPQRESPVQQNFSRAKNFTQSWASTSLQHWKNREETYLQKLLKETVQLSVQAWKYNLQRQGLATHSIQNKGHIPQTVKGNYSNDSLQGSSEKDN